MLPKYAISRILPDITLSASGASVEIETFSGRMAKCTVAAAPRVRSDVALIAGSVADQRIDTASDAAFFSGETDEERAANIQRLIEQGVIAPFDEAAPVAPEPTNPDPPAVPRRVAQPSEE